MRATRARPSRPHEWLQVDCSLFHEAPAKPYIPWARLLDAVEAWRAGGLIDRFWFVRKPPGLRLRFQASSRAAAFQSELSTWLLDAEQRNDIRGFRFTVYEPETHRFGGVVGMDLAHTLFDAAATLPLQFHANGAAPLRGLEVSIATTTNLLGRCLDDTAEAWDVWCRLYDAIPTLKVGAKSETELCNACFTGVQALAEALGESWAPLLDNVSAAHDHVGRGLCALSRAGALRVGLRGWLVAATIFDWNRFGLPNALDELKWGVECMKRSLAPDGEGVRLRF